MSTDDVSFPKSAFAPFSNGSVYPNSGDVITSRPFAYIHPSQDQISRPGCWYQPNGLSGPSPVPLPGCFKPAMAIFETGIDDNVANCVTVANDDVARNDGHLASQGLLDQSYSNSSAMQYMISNCPAVSSHFTGHMPAPVMPLIISSQIVKSDNLPPRQVYYHKRHHPPPKTTSTFDISASELKNKSRFSATGASGKSTVVRDCKMSLSSSPPSPCAGSAGGSLCSSISRSHFKPISAQSQLFPSPSNSATTTLPYSPTKKVSGTSNSPTRPSVSPSFRSSTSSSSGIASRKRRADEESNSQRCYRSSGYSSTSDVIAGVGHVRLCDRSSTGSVSPVEPVMRSTDWVSQQQPHKRSKNDNDEDDDVIFVSMEPGIGKHKLNPSSSPNSSLKPFTGVSPKPTMKPSRKSKKDLIKKPLAQVGPTVSPATFSVPSPVYPLQALHQFSSAVPTSFVAQRPTIIAPLSTDAAQLNNATSKGYFLRSSVNGRNVNKDEVDVLTHHVEEQNVSGPSVNTRYQTRSHQKRKVEKPQVRTQATAQPYQVGTAPPLPNTNSAPIAASQASMVIPVDKAIHHPISVETSERSRTILLSDSHRRTSSSTFNKIYEIKGKIGVGGGGVVYAGTRKADNVEVAIKRVPREKVKRWGKLEGRVVPIEFELLHRAAKSGNKGVIKMYDWFERRSSYILVMERPQPVIDLFDYLNQHGAMPQSSAKKIFRQIVEAVRHCHANGVIHRDIKDENVLLNLHTKEAKLIDFGCGTFMKSEPYTEFAGTPEFYPPEWFTDRRYEGRKVDAWSLGVLLYTMVEAEVPFQKEEDIVRCELRHKRLQGSDSSLCRDLIKLMLQKDQSKRLSLEEVLRHPWFNENTNVRNSQATSSKSFDSKKIMSSKQDSFATSKSTQNQDKQVFQPLIMVQYNEKSPPNGYPVSYLAPPMPQTVVHSNECTVHS